MRSIARWPAILVVGLVTVGQAQAQSAQRFSVQGSALYAGLFGNAFEGIDDGVGFEAQVRYTPSALSIGGGFQWTRHNASTSDPDVGEIDGNLKLYGGFVEPRYVFNIPSNVIAPYASARVGVLRESLTLNADVNGTPIEVNGSATAFNINGGGGVLFRLGPRVNLDAGATFGYFNFGDINAEANGQPVEGDFGDGGSGTNLILRLGVAVGIGR